MFRRLGLSLPTALLSVLMLFPSVGLGQEKTEGTVVSTKLIACQFKPGGCEGYLTLETKGGAKPDQVTLKVALGTPIKKARKISIFPRCAENLWRSAMSQIKARSSSNR
jgi:hypothetical protein